MRLKTCAECRQRFTPTRQMQPVCEKDECRLAYAHRAAEKSRQKRLAKLAKEERAAKAKEKRDDKERLARLKPGYLIGKAQDAANEYARLRDYHLGCISCDKPAHWSGGDWHGGHLIPVSRSSFLRLNLKNINKQCNQCNTFQGGNPTAYERGIVARYGQARLDYLKSAPKMRRFDDDYLIRFARIFNKRNRILKKRLGLQ